MVGVLYGDADALNGHYRRIESQYHFPVIAGQNFWHRLTGDPSFYHDLAKVIAPVAVKSDFKEELDKVIAELAENLDL